MVSTSRKMYIWTRLFVWLIFTSFVLFVNFSFGLHQMYQTTGMQTLSHRNTLWVNRTRAWAVFNWATFYGGKWEKLLVKLYISTALRRETYFRSHSVILGWGGQNPRDTQLMIMSLQRPERICFFLAFFFLSRVNKMRLFFHIFLKRIPFLYCTFYIHTQECNYSKSIRKNIVSRQFQIIGQHRSSFT